MSREFSRTDRIADQIHRELAQLLEFEVRDPRIKAATITAVKVSRDLAYAKVYVTVLGNEDAIVEATAALQKASGFLRSALAHRLTARTTPALHFEYDSSIIQGRRLSALIDAAIEADHELDGGSSTSSPDPDADSSR